MEPITIIIGLIALLLGSVITFFVLKNLDLTKSKSVLKDAEKEAERIKKEKIGVRKGIRLIVKTVFATVVDVIDKMKHIFSDMLESF